MRCPSCDSEIPADSDYCYRCGKRIDRYRQDGMGGFCARCGNQMDSDHRFCKICGLPAVEPPSYSGAASYDCGFRTVDASATRVNDSGSIGWAILSFLFPLVGLILWLAWLGLKPRCSRMAGYGLLAHVICVVIVPILMFMLLAFVPV